VVIVFVFFMRTFIAIDITPEIREQIAAFIQDNRNALTGARWVRPEGMHITLKFLGEISAEQKQSVEAALEQVRASNLDLTVGGLGFFPSERRPRVFWVGIQSSEALPALAAAIDERLIPLGFDREKQAYTPHLTLARFNPGVKAGNPASEAKKLLERQQPNFGTMTASEFFLFQSKLSPQGAQYTKLARFSLG
jgi:RNA 2',3'-cyclic 3'-phosphodiesterase